MRRAVVWALAVALSVGVLTVSRAAPTTTYTHGFDISWPQCDGGRAASLPDSTRATFVILGLTHGEGHTANPCLPAQLAWAHRHHVRVGAYLVPSYPTARQLRAAAAGPVEQCGRDLACRRHNDGAAQAVDALEVMRTAGVPAPMVWVDVEFRQRHPWSHDRAENVDVLQGVLDALTAAHMPYGIYTTSYMWAHITGGWVVRAPQWLPSGDGDPAHAKRQCHRTGSGGRTWIVQYTRRFDENLTCPVMDAVPGRHGPLWRFRNSRLALGSHGPAVTAAQRALESPWRDGRYDARTTGVVASFQADRGLPVDGRVDRDDWRALGAFARHGGHGFLLDRVALPA